MLEGEIFVWESKHGWKIVEAWRDKYGCPHGKYIVLQDGLTWELAVNFAERIRKSFRLA